MLRKSSRVSIEDIDLDAVKSDISRVTRRAFFGRAGTATLSATAVAMLAGSPALAGDVMKGGATQGDIDILNVALGLEYQAIAAYGVGAKSGLLSKPVLGVAVAFQGHHKEHAALLDKTVRTLGGKAVQAQAKYDFPVGDLKSEADVLQFAAGLEKNAASAYLSVIPSFHNRELAKAAASILGDETMHWAVLRQAVGKNPVPNAFIS